MSCASCALFLEMVLQREPDITKVFWEGRDIFKKALNQARQGSANMDSLIALGVGVAYSYSLTALFRGSRHVYFNAATGIIDLVIFDKTGTLTEGKANVTDLLNISPLEDDISKVSEAIAISNQTLNTIKQNLFWAFAYNAVAIPFAVAGKLNPTIASAAMAFSSVSVIINSLRLNRPSGAHKKTVLKNVNNLSFGVQLFL